jgi:hypothetical protein
MHIREKLCRVLKKNLCSTIPTMYWLTLLILILIVLVSHVEDHNSRVVFGHKRFIENKYVPDINDFKQHTLKQLNELDEDHKKKEYLPMTLSRLVLQRCSSGSRLEPHLCITSAKSVFDF